MKAIVIGGGIGGLSAALALERIGADCEVFEQAGELREVGAGLTVWAPGPMGEPDRLRVAERADPLDSGGGFAAVDGEPGEP
jgi:2-polyprenyl-6-methoxyphenol hydroxylase-like FAD-dependent oxidoreductase